MWVHFTAYILHSVNNVFARLERHFQFFAFFSFAHFYSYCFYFPLYQLVLSFGSELHLILVSIFLASPHNNALLESELGKSLQFLGLGLVYRFGSIFGQILLFGEMLKSPPPPPQPPPPPPPPPPPTPPPNRKIIIKNRVLSTESVKRIVGGRWRDFCFTQPLVWRNLGRPAGNRLRRLPNPRPSQLPSALRPVLEKPPPLPPHPPRPD